MLPYGTHHDAEQRRAPGCVFGKADVVQWFAEDGSVIIFINQFDEDAGETHMVRHGLVGVELGRERDFKYKEYCSLCYCNTVKEEQGAFTLGE